ncbi:hypothetical protein GLGCALEP_04680 [Pseudomonas sp. MM221]|nr:hypothetical protein DBADOPDK_04561 [Pseudomonas sp. MM223]CAI3807825.1 hypothetical protein GLGCALEP_04680 [Pseudomonas sp. MM221]
MRRTTQAPSKNIQSEAEILDEELRKLRAYSPWMDVLLFCIGAVSTVGMLIAGIFIARWL